MCNKFKEAKAYLLKAIEHDKNDPTFIGAFGYHYFL